MFTKWHICRMHSPYHININPYIFLNRLSELRFQTTDNVTEIDRRLTEMTGKKIRSVSRSVTGPFSGSFRSVGQSGQYRSHCLADSERAIWTMHSGDMAFGRTIGL